MNKKSLLLFLRDISNFCPPKKNQTFLKKYNLRGVTRKVGKQERKPRKNEGDRAREKIKRILVKATRPFSFQKHEEESGIRG